MATELVLSAFFPLLFEKLDSAAVKQIARNSGVDADIKKWERSVKQIQGVLNDASRKEINSDHVKRWLNDLQHLAYDIDDVLDDFATEARHREFTDEPETHISKVTKLFPGPFSKHSIWTRTMKDKINVITAKLQDLMEEKAALGLKVKEEPGLINKNRKLQTSLVDAPSIVGRHVEKEALVKKLLGGESCHQNFSIVPIVGMGGVGKTTLAKLVYNEVQVKFELKAWVCVSNEFDSFAISKVIFQSVTGENKVFEDLNLLQVALRDHLTGKRFLLVLDNVWTERYEDWETLVAPFHGCARGSKLIMTTRKDHLLRKLGCNNLNQLESLSPKDALSLIALQALGVTNFDSHLSLKPYALGIVKKCDGLPLALKALGRLLSTKKDEAYWKKVLNSEIWDLPVEGEIIPALKLSYHDLSARLKQLFAYCSLFPKNYVFNKKSLILIWMAEGFLHQSPPRDLIEESIGHEYFDELLSRSFFQHAPYNDSFFVMHDMMNVLATYVASEFFVRLDNEATGVVRKDMLEQYRHMSFVRELYVTYKKLEAFKEAKNLRTFMPTTVGVLPSYVIYSMSNKVMVDLLPNLPLLRVLSLSNFNISEVPETIGTLRHLRYLNLSLTKITHLPENVCNLYNLQTLILAGCYHLAKLPNNFLKLKHLLHLDIRGTPLLKNLPLGISELKSLQTLSKIIIGCESRFEIVMLKNLENLCGEISIVGMENVKNAFDAREANISQKKLSKLEFGWSDEYNGSRNIVLEKDVLNELKPRNDYLEELEIRSYGGLEFPKWVGDPSFLRLNHVTIRGCKGCISLPPLGQLPSLKELVISGLHVVNVGLELFGASGAFPSLEILSFEEMRGWEKWSTHGRVVFPCLQQLSIDDCPNLVEVTLGALPSLNVLKIYKCDSGVLRKLVEVCSTVIELKIGYISGLNDAVWRGVIEYLGAVEELIIDECNEIRYLWESEAVASKFLVKLRELSVVDCNNLVSLGEKEEEDDCRSNLLTSLRMLYVSYCNNMERLSCPYSIERLSVWDCTSVTIISLPIGGQKLKSLTITSCEKLLETEQRWKMTSNYPSNVCVLELNHFVHLTQLKIFDCKNLESFPQNELPTLTSLKELEILECPCMDTSSGFWPPNLHSLKIGTLKKSMLKWGPQNFPTSLVELELYGDDRVSSLGQISHLLPSSLTSLVIHEFKRLESCGMGLQHLTALQHLSFWGCPNLNKFSNLKHLTSIKHLDIRRCPNLSTLSQPHHLSSLQHLYFDECPNMMDLPEVLLPSLLSLTIKECPKLTERCSERGNYWPLISHIPCLRTSSG